MAHVGQYPLEQSSCTRVLLSEGLTISYDFRTTKALFLTKSPIIASNARAIFNSLKR
jgi:hypothetical protein